MLLPHHSYRTSSKPLTSMIFSSPICKMDHTDNMLLDGVKDTHQSLTINVLLDTRSMPIHLPLLYNCFCTTVAESRGCRRDFIALRASDVYYLIWQLYQKICQPLPRRESI
jgi:hypothetical protein